MHHDSLVLGRWTQTRDICNGHNDILHGRATIGASVSKMSREKHAKDYKPKLISICLLHRDKESLLFMEQIKRKYLRKLLNRSVQSKLRDYLRVFHKCESRARKQYSEMIDMDVDDFVKMLILDGCFIIVYLVERILEEMQEMV
ncbi:hypothetical protein Taro_030168 [Colocasia esculenta]|uniref:Uncharacterized protein n=1 Tax=Colocasia esculenta TaxID=4460 RepID=A0A843VTC2_COLES|nr:hypothetical protein [Colocasia esculenta]